MQPDKWQEIKWQVKDGFKDAEFSDSSLPEPMVGKVETILFNGPLGKMKLEYITRPVILDKKMHGSRRIGATTEIEYVYSDTEFSHQFKAYKWDESQDDWVEIEKGGMFSQ